MRNPMTNGDIVKITAEFTNLAEKIKRETAELVMEYPEDDWVTNYRYFVNTMTGWYEMVEKALGEDDFKVLEAYWHATGDCPDERTKYGIALAEISVFGRVHCNFINE